MEWWFYGSCYSSSNENEDTLAMVFENSFAMGRREPFELDKPVCRSGDQLRTQPIVGATLYSVFGKAKLQGVAVHVYVALRVVGQRSVGAIKA